MNWYMTVLPNNKYVIIGDTWDGKEIAGVVTEQEGNYVTFSDGTKCFVVWPNRNISYDEARKLREELIFCGLRYPYEFDTAWLSYGVRPRIPTYA